MAVLEVISFIQDGFGILVGDDEITEQNFGALAGIARYILGKRAAVAAS